MDILSSLFLGLITGFAEFFPVSASAHQQLFYQLTGLERADAWHLAAHIGCLFAIIVLFFARIKHTLQEMQIASGFRSKRQADPAATAEGRLILTAAIPMFLGLLLLTRIERYTPGFWFLALMLCINGIAIYVPQFLPGANKDSRGFSRLDSLILGLASALSIFPGISRLNAVLCAGRLRGGDLSYITDLSVLLGIPWLLGLLILDTVAVVIAPVSLSLITILSLALCCIAAFGASYLAISLLRFLAVKIGFTGFALYSWGIGFVCFVYYLII